MMKKPVVCTTLMVEVMGPADASRKRIKFVENILRSCIRTLDKDFRTSRIPQMKGFSLKPEPLRRRKGKHGKK
jgi:hypothetical protein